MNEDYKEVFDDVRTWQTEGLVETAVEVDKDYWKDFFWWGVSGEWLHSYVIEQTGIDPFIGSLKTFFQNVYLWLTQKWGQLASWFAGLESYIQSLWNALAASISALYHWIGEKIEGIITLIGNWAMILWEWLISDIWKLVDFIITPLREAWNYLTETLAWWFERIRAAIASFMSDPLQWVYDLGALLWEVMQYLAGQVWDSLVTTANAVASWIGERISALAPQLVEYLRDVLFWIWEQIRTTYVFVKDNIAPAVWEATTGALGYLKDQFVHLIGLAYNEILDLARGFSPMTPEKAVTLAALMFGAAVGTGALAHGIALSVEAIPNLKYMGVHYLSAFAARMGSFGVISGATMGVIAATSLRTPFTYYMKSILRPEQPSIMDLMMMAVKPDIPLDVFRKGMAYQGFSEYWINAFQRTMYNEPRYFELSMMGEDESATPEWLMLKARRSGYTPKDSEVFVSSLLKKVTRTQRQDYYKQAFNLFKEGYIDKVQFEEYLDDLDMRPEAKVLAVSAAEFAYRYDLMRDLVGAYQTAYRNDLTTEEEFTGSLAALGIEPERVDALAYIEWVRKTPSALKKERREIEKAWREVQKKYTSLYIESFRRGLLTEEQLASCLVAIGIKERVAIATARYEAIKLVPKPKLPEILPPAIPPPPKPPEFEE